MKRYLYTFAGALLAGLAAGFWLWHTTTETPDRVAGILIATPKGRLDVDSVERVRVREGQTLTFVVVNASDVARNVALGFFRGQTPVNVCDVEIAPVAIAAQRSETVTCAVSPGIVDRFPADPADADETGGPGARAFDYRVSLDGAAHDDARLIVER